MGYKNFGVDVSLANEIRGYIKNGDVKNLVKICGQLDTTPRELVMLECEPTLRDAVCEKLGFVWVG